MHRYIYSLRTLLTLMAIVPPLVGVTYHLATAWFWFPAYLPEINGYRLPVAGGSSYSISADGTVSDDFQEASPLEGQ